ncbi:hypothetical protein [Pseudomonas entomophila]|uniref:type III secretion apparatus assembly protein SctX n=1 Tax=Pseudomonas entomophila TaxID=312306 RepID=UPI001F0170CE|nr:hypothetical protein [Pseudomonas entomophila]MCG8291454.1 hypothetical protein [Pseudomonas entomophila]
MSRVESWGGGALPGLGSLEPLGGGDWSIREPMVPCGEQVEAQIPRLYPANQSQQALLAYARPPVATFARLLSPQAYRRARGELRKLVREHDHPAARWLDELEADERQLQMLVQLLIEV